MSRPEDRSTGPQPGAQAQRGTADVSGSAANVTGTGESAGATSTSLHDQPVTRAEPSASYAPGPGPQPGYATAPRSESTGGFGFGGVFALVAGLLTFFTGLAFVVRASFYPTLANYAYRTNSVHTWGWILFGLGIALFAVGAIYLLGMSFARYLGVAIAVVTTVAGFLILPYSPFSGIFIVGTSLLAVWGLLRNDSRDEARSDSMSM
jgi:hypothetical protein